MKITISGRPGSGKSTVGKKVAQELKLNYFCAGDFQRKIAEEKGMTILELAKIAEKNSEIDGKTDSWVEAVGEADDNFVMVGRTAFNFIPDSIKIFLDVAADEAARRVYHDMRAEEKENTTQGKTFESLKAREESEKKRYMEYYKIDYTNPDSYDLVIDTTGMPIANVVSKIIKFIKERE